MASESLHPYGGFHQVNIERCGGDSRRVVAAEYLWADAVAHQHSRRQAVRETDDLPKSFGTQGGEACGR